MSKPADRLVWAVQTMDVQPADRVMEIGCGHGVAVTLVCEKLTTGSILAIDRSARMIDMASRRNARFPNATFRTVSLDRADLGDAHFDKVLAIHVPVLLRGDPTRELAIIRDHLAPDGHLFVSFQPLDPSHTQPTVDRLTAILARYGFTTKATVADLPSGRTACLKAGLR